MKFNLAMSVGVLALLGLLGVTLAEMRTAEPQPAQDPQPAQTDASSVETPTPEQPSLPPVPAAADPAGTAPAAVAEPAGQADQLPAPVTESAPVTGSAGHAIARGTRSNRARGLFYMRSDGTTVGRVTSIDRNTLLLVPVSGALVSFLQDRKIVAQGLTNEEGIFAVKGLTSMGVYSVTASAPDYVCMFATVILPYDPEADRAKASAKRVGVTPGWVNEIRFASLVPASEEGVPGDGEGAGDGEEPGDAASDSLSPMQGMSREDFLAALRNGLFGSDAGGLPGGGMSPGLGSGMGGGGGGGAGGGGGGGLGGALIGAGVAAGVGAALGGGGDGDDNQASPSRP